MCMIHIKHKAIAENYIPTKSYLYEHTILEFVTSKNSTSKNNSAHLLSSSQFLSLSLSISICVAQWLSGLTLSWNFEYHKNEINNRNHDLYAFHWYWNKKYKTIENFVQIFLACYELPYTFF